MLKMLVLQDKNKIREALEIIKKNNHCEDTELGSRDCESCCFKVKEGFDSSCYIVTTRKKFFRNDEDTYYNLSFIKAIKELEKELREGVYIQEEMEI